VTRTGLLAFSLLLTSGCALMADHTPRPQDRLECQVLTDALLRNHVFPLSAVPRLAAEGGKAVYCRIEQPNPFVVDLHTRLDLYGIFSEAAQDAILGTVRQARSPSFKPIIVKFYKKENWVIEENQSGRYEGREKEKLLRTVIVK
jgi:hypothetical protein